VEGRMCEGRERTSKWRQCWNKRNQEGSPGAEHHFRRKIEVTITVSHRIDGMVAMNQWNCVHTRQDRGRTVQEREKGYSTHSLHYVLSSQNKNTFSTRCRYMVGTTSLDKELHDAEQQKVGIQTIRERKHCSLTGSTRPFGSTFICLNTLMPSEIGVLFHEWG
jgi:hypothetical protein